MRPVANVESDAQWLIATNAEPWLSVEGPDIARLAGRFIEIVYRLSFWDEPVRPILRFWSEEGAYVDRIAAGPIAGAGMWIGRMPPTTRRLDISPTNRLGPFGFRIERIRARPWLAVVARGLRCQPTRTRSALLTRLIGWRPESDANLAWATGAVPFARFSKWRAERTRVPDLPSPARLDSLEAPRFDWEEQPPILVVIGDGHPVRLRRTVASLLAQVFPNWIATVPHAGIVDDPRICLSAPDFPADLTAWIDAGDVLAPEALACAAEQAHRHPDGRLFYADAVRLDARGRAAPSFQPRWSRPRGAEQSLGDTLIFARDLETWSDDERQLFRRTGEVAPSVLARLSTSQIRPLHRLLIETERPPSAPISTRMPIPSMKATTSIIIPTRDHPALLQRCVASIRAYAGPSPLQFVIIDNASVTEPARRLLAELSHTPDTIVLPYPHPFNFSGMCNAAAAVAHGDILAFLNDDTKMLNPNWLDRLAAHAADPDIGAVGAKLVFPDGRLQHVGIVAGMGGSAGHFGALADAEDLGWADRTSMPHEVSAVTGACLAVERSKFWAVGGFDEKHLPVELSDVDLCLKLNARGWQTLIDPGVTILHEESASRGGATFRRLAVYESQRNIFVDRWRHVLRDDPWFHPGLSLYSFAPALA